MNFRNASHMTSLRSMHGAVVLLLGPHLGAISGVSAHVHALLQSRLREQFVLDHLVVGKEGRDETSLRRWLRLAGSPLSLAAAIRRQRPTLLHVNSSLNAGAFWRDLAYMIVAKLHGVRVVCQIHGGKLPQAFLGGTYAAQALLRRLLALPDALVVLAETEVAAYRRFLPQQRIALIPNGVDCRDLAAPRPARSADSPLRMVYCGRLVRGKGLDELVTGFAAAHRQGCEAMLTIVGSGAEEQRVRARVTQLRLDHAVTFAGAAHGEAKARLLRQGDVFVLPSYSEGLPFALLEAMAAGNAVIATRVGAIPDVVLPGIHGMLVPPRDATALADAIVRMSRDRTALASMQQACTGRITAGYSLEPLAARFADLYGQVLGDARILPREGEGRRGTQGSSRHVAECAE